MRFKSVPKGYSERVKLARLRKDGNLMPLEEGETLPPEEGEDGSGNNRGGFEEAG